MNEEKKIMESEHFTDAPVFPPGSLIIVIGQRYAKRIKKKKN